MRGQSALASQLQLQLEARDGMKLQIVLFNLLYVKEIDFQKMCQAISVEISILLK